MKETLQEIIRVAEDPSGYARAWKAANGRPVVGYLCSYVPEEIIHASGALPLRLLPPGGLAGGGSEAHLQAYSCSLARGVLGDLLSGRYDFLDGLVFPHTCDTLQRVSDIWRLNRPGGFHLDVVLPVQTHTRSARDYTVAVFEKFRRELGQALGQTIDDTRQKEAAETYNRLRGAIQRLLLRRCRHPDLMPGSDLQALMRATTVMAREALADASEVLADGLDAALPSPAQGGKRLLISGGTCSATGIHAAIEASGAHVVWEDLCTAARALEGHIHPSDGGVAALAARYLARGLCPAKHGGLEARAGQLVRLARATSADGVVLVTLKFCDPHAFDLPHLTAALDAQAIPYLLVEIEEGNGTGGQLRTRLEAFVERL